MNKKNQQPNPVSTQTKLFLAIGCLVLATALLVVLSSTIAQASAYPNDSNRTVIAHYHKDVDCTITDIEARWCVYYWKVDISYSNDEYGLSGKQTLTYKDGAAFKDARRGDHIAAVLHSELDNETNEVIDRHLGNIVVSSGYDNESVRLR